MPDPQLPQEATAAALPGWPTPVPPLPTLPPTLPYLDWKQAQLWREVVEWEHHEIIELQLQATYWHKKAVRFRDIAELAVIGIVIILIIGIFTCLGLLLGATFGYL